MSRRLRERYSSFTFCKLYQKFRKSPVQGWNGTRHRTRLISIISSIGGSGRIALKARTTSHNLVPLYNHPQLIHICVCLIVMFLYVSIDLLSG